MPHTTTGERNEIKDPNRVDFKSIFYRESIRKWEMIQALREGSDAMRDGRERWLPKLKEEPQEKYDMRLQLSVLYPGLDNGIRRIVAKPFSKPVVVVDEKLLGERTKVTLENTDGNGKSFHEFGAQVFDVANQFGMAHVLVDFPQVATVTETAEGEAEVVTPSLAEEREQEIAPRLVVVRPDQVFGWRAVGETLTMVRIFEQDLRDKGIFGETLVNIIRVIGRTDWQIWEQELREDSESQNKNTQPSGENEGEWKLVKAGTHTFGEVPLLTYYIPNKQTGFMEAEPTHEALADTNVSHWQSQSDQRNILHVARVPVMFASGFEDEEIQAGIVVGAQSLVSSRSEEADLKFVEHTGAAIESGRQDLLDLEDKMRAMGLQPMLPNQTGDIKATGIAIDEAQSQSEVQSWIRVLETFLLRVTQWAARWVEEDVPDTVSVQIFNDFVIGLLGDKDAKTLLEMRLSMQIDHETYLIETQRRGMLREDADLDDIMRKVEAESASMPGEPPEGGPQPAGTETPKPHRHTSDNPGGLDSEPHEHTQEEACGVNLDGTPHSAPHRHTEEFPGGEVCE